MAYINLSQLIALISGFIVMLVQGSLYVFGTMTPYIYTYLYYEGKVAPIQDIKISLSANFPS